MLLRSGTAPFALESGLTGMKVNLFSDCARKAMDAQNISSAIGCRGLAVQESGAYSSKGGRMLAGVALTIMLVSLVH